MTDLPRIPHVRMHVMNHDRLARSGRAALDLAACLAVQHDGAQGPLGGV